MDQLCIDQEDAVQKAQVVANMDTIYRNASRILILLEDLDIKPDMEQVLELMAHSPSEPENDADRDRQRRSAFEENYAECVARGLTKSLFSFAKMVFTRCRWFQRAWCFHEYQLSAERTFVFVGHNRSCISLEQWFFYALFRETTAPKDYEVPDIFMHLVFARFTDGIGLNHPDEIEQHNLPLLFVELDSLLCFLLKDLISIALNTSGIFLGFDHDVASKADCQFVLGLILLAAGYPTALDLIGPCLHKRPAPCHQGVLRWPLAHEMNMLHGDDWGAARTSPTPGVGYIRRDAVALDLYFLCCQPRSPAKERIEAAEVWRTLSEKPHSDPTDVGIATFAAALDIEPHFMVRSIRAFFEARRTSTPAREDEAMAVIDAYSSKAYMPGSEEDMTALENIISNMLKQLTYIERTVPLAARIDSARHAHAILFIPSRLADENLSDFRYAVPAALNDPKSALVRRLWILEESRTSDSRLSIVGQGFYFGQTLTENCEVTYVGDVTVAGRWNEDMDDEYESADNWVVFKDDISDIDIEWDANGGRRVSDVHNEVYMPETASDEESDC